MKPSGSRARLACQPPRLSAGVPAAAAASEQPAEWLHALAADVEAAQLAPEHAATLAETVAAYRRPAIGAELDMARLPQILADMHVWEPQRSSLWQRFRDWLNTVLFDGPIFDLNVEWLDALLQISTAEWVWRLCMATFLTAAVVVVVREVRQAHWRPRRRRAAVAATPSVQAAAPALSWQDVMALPLHQRPSAILRLVLASLDVDGMAFAGAGHTHRDIARAATRLDEARGASLRKLASGAERARFGGWRPDAEESERLVCFGREILASAPSSGEPASPAEDATPAASGEVDEASR